MGAVVVAEYMYGWPRPWYFYVCNASIFASALEVPLFVLFAGGRFRMACDPSTINALVCLHGISVSACHQPSVNESELRYPRD